MSSGVWKFKPSEIKRAVETVHQAGYIVTSMTVKDGEFTLGMAKPGEATTAEINPLDLEAERLRQQKGAH